VGGKKLGERQANHALPQTVGRHIYSLIRIIEKITAEKNISFTEEEDTWFNGQMNVPVKTYSFSYPVELGDIEVVGEHRINTWRKTNWYKHIHSTDIYLWNIQLISEHKLPELKVSTNSWFRVNLLHQSKLTVKSSDKLLEHRLTVSKNVADLLLPGSESSSASIFSSNNVISTSFNSLVDHEGMIRKALLVFEEIAGGVNTPANKA